MLKNKNGLAVYGVIVVLFLTNHSAPVFAQFGIPKLPVELPLTLPGFPKKEDDKPGANLGILAGGCALVGGAAALVAKKYAEIAAEKDNLSESEAEKLETNYMLGFALAGCAIGSSVAERIIQNMSESAKLAQQEAWEQAQMQTGPVEWQDPNDMTSRGSTELTEIEAMPDGQKCGTRRDIITAEEGTAEPYQRVCQGSDGTWEPALG